MKGNLLEEAEEKRLLNLRRLNLKNRKNRLTSGAQPGGEAFGVLAPPEIFKTLHSNFDICRNFQRMKMKFYILIIFKKSYCNFSLSCSLIIISLQDLS